MIGLIALSSVIIPFVGQNFGAKNFERIKNANHFSLRFAIIWGLSSWILLALLSTIIASTFATDIIVQELIKEFFWIVPFGFAFQGISQIISASCNALDRPLHSTSINFMRLFAFLIPSTYIGSIIFGSKGFFIGIALGNLATGIVAWFWFRNNILPKALEN